jgi:hypothetical protein
MKLANSLLLCTLALVGCPRRVQPSDVPDYKPAIYLYPTKDAQVAVGLSHLSKEDFVYPPFSHGMRGWRVSASPNGIMSDDKGRRFDYLFWEGRLTEPPKYNPEEGFVVASNDLVAFFQEKLKEIGLNDRESNEFIVYWVPLLQKNRWTYINFITDEYAKIAKLEVTPNPESVLQMYMVFRGLDLPQQFKPQTFKPFRRIGFSVVEWGGGPLQ